MHTILKGAIAVCLVFGSVSSAQAIAGGPVFTMGAATTSVATGQEFTVDIVIDARTHDVLASVIEVSFPSSGLQALSIVAGDYLTDVILAGSVSDGAATITLGSGTEGSPAQGVGTVATITFKALEAGVHDISFTLGTMVAVAGESGDATDTMTGITVTVSGDAVAPEPTEAPAGGGGAGGSGGSGSGSSGGGSGSMVTPQITPTPTPQSAAQQAGQVPTGPGDYTVIAVLVGAITVLLYAGYMSTDHFRKQDAKAVAGKSNTETDRFDFKDKA